MLLRPIGFGASQVDFASLNVREQVAWVHGTHVLAGVYGVGLIKMVNPTKSQPQPDPLPKPRATGFSKPRARYRAASSMGLPYTRMRLLYKRIWHGAGMQVFARPGSVVVELLPYCLNNASDFWELSRTLRLRHYIWRNPDPALSHCSPNKPTCKVHAPKPSPDTPTPKPQNLTPKPPADSRNLKSETLFA
jgi:hypothetical protein